MINDHSSDVIDNEEIQSFVDCEVGRCNFVSISWSERITSEVATLYDPTQDVFSVLDLSKWEW